MAVRGKPLIDFDPSAFTWPNSVSRSGHYLLERGLDATQRRARERWLGGVARLDAAFGRMVAADFGHASDDRLLRSLLARHGLFTERFFRSRVRERVARRFARNLVDLEELSGVALPRWAYATRAGGSVSDLIVTVADALFCQAAARALEDAEAVAALEVWCEGAEKPRSCLLCGQEFRLLDVPDWAYYGSDGYAACCFRCPIQLRPDRARLAQLVPAFIGACGFVPSSEASPVCHAFTARLTRKQWPAVMRLWAAMGGVENVKRRYGSWFRALALTGALPDGTLVTQKGVRCLSTDGHVCHSLDEQRIDNWLAEHRVPHEREPKYPYHRALNPTGTRRADWRVGKTFIEYCGLAGDPEYDRKMDEKLLLTQHASISLIALYPQDLDHLNDRLAGLLPA